MDIKMEGQVKWFKKNKGYGYIVGEDNESYFFELTDCIKDYDNFTEGEKVLFLPAFKGIDYAKKVEKKDYE